MPWLIILAIIALPVIEIALFIEATQWIGGLWTILLAIFTGIAGIALVRRQGLGTMMRIRSQLDRGEMPVSDAFDGICLLAAGLLLLLPGFLTDFVGLPLLLPPVRQGLRRWLARHVRTVVATHHGPHPGAGPQPRPGQTVIDVDYTVVKDADVTAKDDDPQQPRP